MDDLHDVRTRALDFAEGIRVATEGAAAGLRRRYVARLAGTAGPSTLAAAREECLEVAAKDQAEDARIAASLLDEAARAWDVART